LSIQHKKAFICAWDKEVFFGIEPESIATLMFDLLANTSACVVSTPPELIEPTAWQALLFEQTVLSIGCISVENLGVMPTHEKVIPPPPPPVPPPPDPVSLLLHAINRDETEHIKKMTTNIFFIK
jgi:hypothetical protein